jgi:hypothetical protein
MRKLVVAILFSGFLALFAAILPTFAAPAQSDNTVTVASTAPLIGRTTVQVSVTTACTIPVGSSFDSSYENVTVNQTVSHTVVSTQGYFAPTCDGKEHTYQVNLTPSAGSLSYNPGPATADASFNAYYFDPSTGYGNVHADSGLVVIRIVHG